MYNAHCFSVKWVQITCTRSKSKAHLFPFAVEFLVMLFDLHEPNGHVQVDALYDRERNLALSKKTVSGRSYVCCACLYDCFYLFYWVSVRMWCGIGIVSIYRIECVRVCMWHMSRIPSYTHPACHRRVRPCAYRQLRKSYWQVCCAYTFVSNWLTITTCALPSSAGRTMNPYICHINCVNMETKTDKPKSTHTSRKTKMKGHRTNIGLHAAN